MKRTAAIKSNNAGQYFFSLYISSVMNTHLPSILKRVKSIKTSAQVFVVLLAISYLQAFTVNAQTCTANAGGNAIVCGSGTTLVGTVSGSIGSGSPAWTFISGPVTPVITTPASLTTTVTGMTADGDYVFQLSRSCSSGTAISTVTITAHPRPASFTAGPDITTVCATTGTTPLAGVIPAGFTGTWRAANIYSIGRNGTLVSTNSSFSSTTVATPVFSLVNKADHTTDPAYYAILRITSVDGICSYEDTTIVRFIPNTALLYPLTRTSCLGTGAQAFIVASTGSSIFATSQPGVAGSTAAGTTVTLDVVSQPAGGSIAYNRIDDDGRIYFNGITVPGTYKFKIIASNSCGSDTTAELTYNFTGITPNNVSFQPSGHGAPEQLVLYSSAGSGGEMHCNSMAGTTTPETFYFSVNPIDSPTVTTTVTPNATLPPGGAPTVVVSGAGTYNRSATVTPPSGGWRVGTYAFAVNTSNGSCGITQPYFIHISDNARPAIAVPDVNVCYPGTGAISATIPLPAIYKGVVNSSYFQSLPAFYNFTLISKPSGSATPTYTTSNLRTITTASTTISNLDKAGDYQFSITFFNGNGVGPFLEAEYACSSAATVDTFTIHLENLINSNAGSDQNPGCIDSAALAGNSPGVGTGAWSIVSVPSGATPSFRNAATPLTYVSGLDYHGNYAFAWKITTPLGACVSTDTTVVTITCTLPVTLISFNAVKAVGGVSLQWVTAEEENNKGFELEHSADGRSWNNIAFVAGKADSRNGNAPLNYSYLHNNPYYGNNYYRLKLTDLDGTYTYSPTRQVTYDQAAPIAITPNPADGILSLHGVTGKCIIAISNTTGQVVLTKETTGNTDQNIAIDHLPSGVYFIMVKNEQGIISNQKIVKR